MGLVENLESLHAICDELLSYNPTIKIIWDPILKSSSGFLFHEQFEENQLKNLLKKIYLITPNIIEAELLFNTNHPETIIQKGFSDSTTILLKGGHTTTNDANDILISADSFQIIESKRIQNAAKHGSGCVLSSAISANIAHQHTVLASCKNAKNYIHQYLQSSSHLLGFHS
jgi:hydroxymethylpyrimidine/phosphomethylpyrimidine kinase